MVSATLIEAFTTQFGHGLKVRDADGNERKMFGKGSAPNITSGTPITFTVTQKGQNYHYSNLQVGRQPSGGWTDTTSPSARPVPLPKRPEASDKDARMMFVVGITGRAMSSGQFGIADVMTLTLAVNAAYDALLKRPSERSQERTDEPPPPSEADYGGDAPPEW